MNRKYSIKLLLGAVLLVIPVPVSAADFYYVQPASVKFYAAPSFSSPVLGRVDSGYRFEATGKQGNWLKLVFFGKSAYLPAVQATTRAPLGKTSAGNSEQQRKLSSRARMSSGTAAVAGVKGLTYEDRARLSKGERMDYDALDKVDTMTPTSEELRQFMAGGKP